MKLIIILLFYLLSSSSSIAEEIKDCSKKKLVNKILCKTMGNKDNKSKFSFGLDTKNIKEKKYLTDWFKKK
tara:strand:+ start:192 stop:404 length:213 start_codon:yes stop_codon:yes gene_type:complete